MSIIYKAKFFLKASALITLYFSFFLPHIDYCSEIWGNTYRTNLIPLFTVQNRVVRIICGAKACDHTNIFFPCGVGPSHLVASSTFVVNSLQIPVFCDGLPLLAIHTCPFKISFDTVFPSQLWSSSSSSATLFFKSNQIKFIVTLYNTYKSNQGKPYIIM